MKSPGLRIRTGPSRWPRPAARQFAILGGCRSLAAVLVLMHLRVYTTLSPIDELQHLDYVDSMTRFDIVRSGETVGPVAMREEACRGVDSPGFATPSCDAPVLRPEQFQESGINTAATHPPVYYLTTGAVAEVVDAVPGVESFLAAARSVGLLWLGFGLALIFALARRLGANVMSAAGACLLRSVLCFSSLSSPEKDRALGKDSTPMRDGRLADGPPGGVPPRSWWWRASYRRSLARPQPQRSRSTGRRHPIWRPSSTCRGSAPPSSWATSSPSSRRSKTLTSRPFCRRLGSH